MLFRSAAAEGWAKRAVTGMPRAAQTRSALNELPPDAKKFELASIGCSSCAGGTFRQHCGVASGGQCAACEDGAFKVGAQDWDTQCRVCATGRFGHVSYSKAGEQHCRDCPTGKFQLGPGQTSCAQCASCPAGFTRVGCGADSSGTCEKCAQGSFKDGHHLWNTGCSLCESGRYGSSAHSQTSVHHCIN